MTVQPASATPSDAGSADDDGQPGAPGAASEPHGGAGADPGPGRADASGPSPTSRGRVRLARAAEAAVVLGWLLVWAVAVAAAATSVVDVELAADLPDWVAPAGAGVVTVLHTAALAHRGGQRTWLWTGLVAAGTAAGLLADRSWALASVSVLSAVVSGVAAVLVTRAAATAWRTLVEFVVALVVAGAGAVAVAAIDADVRPVRYSLVVAAVALALAIVLIGSWGPACTASAGADSSSSPVRPCSSPVWWSTPTSYARTGRPRSSTGSMTRCPG